MVLRQGGSRQRGHRWCARLRGSSVRLVESLLTHAWTAAFLVLPLLLGRGMAEMLIDEVHGFYTKLSKPSWTPPSWAFGVAWSLLYPLMGAASYLLYQANFNTKPAWRVGLVDAAVGLTWALNLSWQYIFFGLRSPRAALPNAVAQLGLAIASVIELLRGLQPRAGFLLLPLIPWLAFAVALNATIVRLNSPEDVAAAVEAAGQEGKPRLRKRAKSPVPRGKATVVKPSALLAKEE